MTNSNAEIDAALKRHFNEQRLGDLAPDVKQGKIERNETRPFRGIESSASFIARQEPPEYLVDGIVERGKLYSLTGFTGHAKTSSALHLAISVAAGPGKFFGDAACDHGSVLFLAGVNPDNVINQWIAGCEHHGLNPAHERVHLHYDRFNFGQATPEPLRQCEAIPDLRPIVVDTLLPFFSGEDDNSNMAMLEAATQFRPLTKLTTLPTVLVQAHPSGKQPDRHNLVPRGGGAFLGEVDGNFTCWKDADGPVRFQSQGKHRGPYFEALHFMVEERSSRAITDSNGRQVPMAIVRALLDIEMCRVVGETVDFDMQLMRLIEEDGSISERAAASALRSNKSRVHRALEVLKNRQAHQTRGAQVEDHEPRN